MGLIKIAQYLHRQCWLYSRNDEGTIVVCFTEVNLTISKTNGGNNRCNVLNVMPK